MSEEALFLGSYDYHKSSFMIVYTVFHIHFSFNCNIIATDLATCSDVEIARHDEHCSLFYKFV